MSIELKSFLELLYSFCKQYISWYERQIKSCNKTPVEAENFRMG